ncbi:MAG: site-2 protease family protein [Candidatus Nealsonbacteria bacterium CG09_land_8_20_14_0_10_42_14]|uniref:Site-2 protease family protein n=1 Tax=Candidatus Nealsonbacteria bacterium CG09_land_8_20_14_0_10_42_14 TaxID=1974707 RepID=A0A2H0WXU2_9BACT|nr:MAG: site-2 protease family protein [Candidatus Nealsonbacteria bacterium CG09_land_8_20_14_0_10_42_14]
MLAIFSLIVLFFSIVLHEIAHGSMALHLGDDTAKNAGRLTLNPIKHIDPFGTIILPLLLLFFTAGQGPIIGWAKPVPINPFNFRDQKWGTLKVSVAGPGMNFLVGIIFGLAIRFISLPDSVLLLFSIIVLYNFAWGIFNLIPIPPFDGSHILFSFIPAKLDQLKLFLQQYGLFLIIIFIVFGLRWIFVGAALLFYLVTGRLFII